MRKTLLASTCLATLLSTAAHAETTITTATTAPVRTSTIKPGAPDDIKITSAGSIKPTVAGPAVTIDSNHKVVNDGTIELTNVDGATGILAGAGTSGGITNSATGEDTNVENYDAPDNDKAGDRTSDEEGKSV